MSVYSKYNNLYTEGSGSRVYLDGEECTDHIEEIEIFETARKVVRVYSKEPITHEKAAELVEELYDEAEIIINGYADVHDLRIV